ncbi:DeoR/GlpR family DNA-binding transcription regulator [Aquibium sp. A9E412]|uniref:DeoR/GlpR family DNA-binding transcription regulator n=1 Tax=Aquibium sp. A9E412 TaxID=2976767 RepID=UPI0025B071AD|nr:DeoR/GlpR family DNA-binding transcription regulator [Aquibium sp. A9E412]MDN2565629.1 DeoR/GlpR family DNA-binding transcription regulator [Aquibium sp. A9E412]
MVKLKQRHGDIVDAVNRHGRVSVEQLAHRFQVSAETIRRDLTFLSEEGRLQKVHGGAKRARLSTEASFADRMGEDAEAKLVIGRKLAALLEPGDTFLIDTGSTTLACAKALATRGPFTVITNSVHIAETFEAARTSTIAYLLGGQFSTGNAQTVGPMAIEQIGAFQADHAILTVSAISAEIGAMDASFEEAQIARGMRRHARNTIVVATAGKAGRTAAFRVCRLDEIDVFVSDRPPGGAFARALAAARVEVR